MTIEELKRVVLEISEMCEKHKNCYDCPLWDDNLKCRLQPPWPDAWWIDDWKKGQKK